jgi:hypothetical protein
MQGECSEDIALNTSGIRGYIQNPKCQISDSDCDISFEIINFELERSGSIDMELNDKDSYCSGMHVKIQATSSIPDQNSSIVSYISADKDKLFKGYNPTEVNIMMIPSIFLSDTAELRSESTGYHISKFEKDVKGSQINYKE